MKTDTSCLTLTLKLGQGVTMEALGVEITVTRLQKGNVRLTFKVPRVVKIMRIFESQVLTPYRGKLLPLEE